jgi:penicillin-binding protein 2
MWALGDTINVTIGQGYFTCAPMQLALATAAIANGGTFYRPHLVRRITDDKGTNCRKRIQPVAPVNYQTRTSRSRAAGMRAVIADKRGTAFGKITVPVEVAGKTGTAEYGEAIAVKGKPLQ